MDREMGRSGLMLMKRWLCDYTGCSNRTHYCWQPHGELNKHYKLFDDMVTAWNRAIEDEEATVDDPPQSLKIKLYSMYEIQDGNKGKSKKAAPTEQASSSSVSPTPATPAASAASAAMAPSPWGASPWPGMPMPLFYQMPAPAWNMPGYQTSKQYCQQQLSPSPKKSSPQRFSAQQQRGQAPSSQEPPSIPLQVQGDAGEAFFYRVEIG